MMTRVAGEDEDDCEGSKSKGNYAKRVIGRKRAMVSKDNNDVWAKPMCVKIHSQDRKFISVLYNTMKKKMSAGVTLFFHVVPCQPSNLLAWIL